MGAKRSALPVIFWLAALSLGALASFGRAPAQEAQTEVSEFLEAWARSLRDVRTLRVRFSQTKELRILRRPRLSEGTALLKGDRLLMRIRSPSGEVETELEVEGDQAKIQYPRLKRLEIYPAREGAAARAPFPMFGADVEALPKTYQIRLLRAREDEVVLVLTPRTEGARFKEVRMRFRAHQIVEVRQESPKGDKVRLEITEFTVNPEIDGEDLKLDVPPDTRVLRMFGEESEKMEKKS